KRGHLSLTAAEPGPFLAGPAGRRAVRTRDQRLEGGGDDIRVDTDAEEITRMVRIGHLHEGHGLRVRARADRVLLVMAQLHAELQRVHRRIDRAVAESLELLLLAEAAYTGLYALLAAFVEKAMRDILDGLLAGDVFLLEDRPDVGGAHFLAAVIRHALNRLAEFHLQSPRQAEVILRFEKIGDAALAGLAVHANDRLI